MKKSLIQFYLDWVNNWLSAERMAEAYGLPAEETLRLIDIGRRLHETAISSPIEKVSTGQTKLD
jgi:hypothetical protein